MTDLELRALSVRCSLCWVSCQHPCIDDQGKQCNTHLARMDAYLTQERNKSFPEIEICNRCHENATFVYDETEDSWLSMCCWANAVNPEVHPALERD